MNVWFRRAWVLGAIVVSAAAQPRWGEAINLREQVRSSISTVGDGSNGKCGTAFRMAWHADHVEAPSGVADVWTDRPARQFSRPSSTGRFRVHYDTTGVHEPALLDGMGGRIAGTSHAFADSTLRIFDRVWVRIVDELGYDPPPADTGGGDAAYDIYLSELPPDWFGETVLESVAPGPFPNDRWQSFLEIDNDFAGLRTPGLAGLRITAAHELFHAVQVGSYGVWDFDEFYFYELSSVWMETMAEPDVEDYLFDLPQYFSSFSGRSLTTITGSFRGYERSIFAFFLGERFGAELLGDIWRSVRERRVLLALDAVLMQRGSSLRDAFREFAVWNHRTSDRAAGATTYRQASRFPRMTTVASMPWMAPSVSMSAQAQPLSHVTFDLRLPSDTLSSIVANVDVASAMQKSLAARSVTFRAANAAPEDGGQPVGDLWFSTRVDIPGVWSQEIVSAVGRGAVPPSNERPWPSPWVLSEAADLVLPVGSVLAPESVEFVSVGAGVTPVDRWSIESQRATTVARIPVRDVRGRLSSGVYVVVLRQGSDQTLWKVAVVR